MQARRQKFFGPFFQKRTAFLLAWLCLQATTASAHARLQEASPPPGATVSTAPESLVLLFSEAIEARFCRVEVLDQSGAAEVSGSWHADPKDARRLIVPVVRLAPGTYAVHWRAVSVDTHKTEGSYKFTVSP